MKPVSYTHLDVYKRQLYERVIEQCRARGFKVETGRFGAEMLVESINDGPVTILIDTDEL